MDASGNAIAVWEAFRVGGTPCCIVQAARYDAVANGWSAVADLSAPGERVVRPQVAVDRNGNAIAVWTRDSFLRSVVQAVRYDAATSTWSAESSLSPPRNGDVRPKVGVDRDGNGVAVWSRSSGRDRFVQAARYDAAADAWGPIAAGRLGGGPRVGVNANGDAVVIWTRFDGTRAIAQGSRYDAARNRIGAAADLSRADRRARQPQVAVDGNGNGVAVWSRSNGANSIIQAAVYSSVCRGKRATRVGTDGDDVLRGTNGADVFDAGKGDDRIFGLRGDDHVCAGPGNDIVRGGGGNDHLFGDAGADLLNGGPGRRDRADGGSGADRCIRVLIRRSC